MKQTLFIALFTTLSMFPLALGVGGCVGDANQPAEAAPREISREVAVSTARRDAASTFNIVAPSGVMASRAGRYWVVDLRTPEGTGAHYAIADDGMIRERRMIQ